MFGTGSQTDRLVVSAADLIANSPTHDTTVAEAAKDTLVSPTQLPPVCTVPDCVGSYWTGDPELPALPLRAQPLGDTEALRGLDFAVGVNAKRITQPRFGTAGSEARGMPLELQRPLLGLDPRLEFDFFPSLHAPLTDKVLLRPGGRDYQWWMDAQSIPLAVKTDAERRLLPEVLNPFMRVVRDVQLGGRLVPKGHRLLAVQPSWKPLRVAPWLGYAREFARSPLPLKLYFGAEPWPGHLHHSLSDDALLPVKRLDVVVREPAVEGDAVATRHGVARHMQGRRGFF